MNSVLRSGVAAALIAGTLAIGAAHGQIVVIVNAANSVKDMSMEELGRLYLGRETAFANGRQVALGEYAPARRPFYQKLLRMSETAVSRHWIGLVFSEQTASPPREFKNPDDARWFVVNHPGAICFVELRSVSIDVKVLTIDGRGPRDPQYGLR